MLLNFNFFKVFFISNSFVVRLIYNSKFFFLLPLFYCLDTFKDTMRLICYSFYYLRRTFSFVGKTYRFYKKGNKLRMYFNRSHKTLLYFKSFFKIKKKKKNKCKFTFLFYTDIGYFKKYIKIIRRLNLFTRRGIKITKSPLFKKVGKISTYR